MKNEKCPNCGGKLGVPEKLKGKPVRCPKCDLEFIPDKVRQKSESNASKDVPHSAAQPVLRSLPMPTAVADDQRESSETVTQLERSDSPLMPPKKRRKSKKKSASNTTEV
ncbi:MAG: hypothetical protein ACPIA2_17755, partial [Mariniblastus sp.]